VRRGWARGAGVFMAANEGEGQEGGVGGSVRDSYRILLCLKTDMICMVNIFDGWKEI